MNILKKYLKRYGLSSSWAARMIGVTRWAYSLWLTGKAKPTDKNKEELERLERSLAAFDKEWSK